MKLDNKQIRNLYEIILSSLESRSELQRIVRFGLDEDLNLITSSDHLRDSAYDLIDWADKNDRAEDLIIALREARPRKVELRKLAEQLGLEAAALTQADIENVIEKVIVKSARFANVEAWAGSLTKSEQTVCRIEIPTAAGTVFGTGFLLGPRVIITNYHVMKDVIVSPVLREQVVIRFGYKTAADGKTLDDGETYKLATDWLLAESPNNPKERPPVAGELDYILLRVVGTPGLDIPKAREDGPPRGWLVPVRHTFAAEEPLLIIQHPQLNPGQETLPLQIALGRVKDPQPYGNELRVTYTVNTSFGASGSPCFTANWELVALHHGSTVGEANEGIPFTSILADLERKNASHVLGDDPRNTLALSAGESPDREIPPPAEEEPSASPGVLLHPALPNPTYFVGRENEVQTIIKSLSSSRETIVLLYGVGGLGKSTLAAYVARKLAGDRFQTVVWSSPFDGKWSLQSLFRDFAVLVPSIGQQADLIEQQNAILSYLRDVPTLLICDNLEDVEDELEKQHFTEFARRVDPGKGTKILLTSRVNSGWLHNLVTQFGAAPPMQLEGLDESASIALLKERGSSIPLLIGADEATLAELVRAVSHNPYLIIILAGLGDYNRIINVAKTLSRDVMRARQELLSDAFRLLQKTAGALALLQQASIFVPSADYEALRAVCEAGLAGADFESALGASLESGLLTLDQLPDQPSRYRLHMLVQQHLVDTPELRPPTELIGSAMERYVEYYAALASRWVGRNLTRLVNREPLRREWRNLSAGWKWAEAQRREALGTLGASQSRTVKMARCVLTYAFALGGLVRLIGLWAEGRDLLEAGVQAAKQLGTEADAQRKLPQLQNNLAWLLANMGESQKAQAIYEESLESAKNVSNTKYALWGALELGRLDVQKGEINRGRARFEEIMNQSRSTGLEDIRAWALLEIGKLDLLAGDMSEARERFGKSKELHHGRKNIQYESSAIRQLAAVDILEGYIDQGRSKLDKSLELTREAEDKNGEAATLVELGRLDARQQQWGSARERLRSALEIAQFVGSVSLQASALLELGKLDAELHNTREAHDELNTSLQLWEQIVNVHGEAATLYQLAVLDQHSGERERAHNRYRRSLRLRNMMGEIYGIAETQLMLGQLLVEEGDRSNGLKMIDDAAQIWDELKMYQEARAAKETARRVRGEV